MSVSFEIANVVASAVEKLKTELSAPDQSKFVAISKIKGLVVLTGASISDVSDEEEEVPNTGSGPSAINVTTATPVSAAAAKPEQTEESMSENVVWVMVGIVMLVCCCAVLACGCKRAKKDKTPGVSDDEEKGAGSSKTVTTGSSKTVTTVTTTTVTTEELEDMESVPVIMESVTALPFPPTHLTPTVQDTFNIEI